MSSLTISEEDEKRVKALGFLNNKGTDNFSARIITVNGKITAAQQKCVAEAAEFPPKVFLGCFGDKYI